jgi:hypothetical protein
VRFLLLFCLTLPSAADVLWATPRDARHQAIDRALNFLYQTAADDVSFARHGSDLLWCFFSVAHTDADPRLRESAARKGRLLAARWRKVHQHVPAHASANDLYLLVSGSYAADRLGFPDSRFKAELRRAVLRFTVSDYLQFDPLRGPPAPDDPERYDIFCDALIRSYFGDAYGIPLGAHYRDVLRWLPSLRPYEGHNEDMEFEAFYAVTHVIYTLNRYNERGIDASLLPEEFRFLRRKLKQAIEQGDPEMVGEALDCLKAAGFADDPDVRAGEQYLVSAQLPDGSWVDDPDDDYTVLHAAWTGLDGLRDYRFHGEVKKIPVH